MNDVKKQRQSFRWQRNFILWTQDIFLFDRSVRFILFAFISLIIGYMLSPLIFIDINTYKTGTVIHRDIILNEDILLLDSISTKLKREHLLNQLSYPYDFFSFKYKKHAKQLTETFQEIAKKTSRYQQQLDDISQQQLKIGQDKFLLSQKIESIQKDFVYYKKLQSLWRRKKASLPFQIRHHKANKNDLLIVSSQLKLIDLKLKNIIFKQKDLWKQRKTIKQTQQNFIKENKNITLQIQEEFQNVKKEFISKTNLAVTLKSFTWVGDLFYHPKVTKSVINVISEVEKNYKIIDSVNFEKQKSWEIHNNETNKVTYIRNRSALLSLDQAKQKLAPLIEAKLPGIDNATLRKVALFLSESLLQSNMQENSILFAKRKQSVLSNLAPVYFNLKKGEFLARSGDNLTAQQVRSINEYMLKFSYTKQIPHLLGMIFLVFIMFFISGRVFLNYSLQTWPIKDFILISSSLLISLFLIKGLIFLKEMLTMRYGNLPPFTYEMIFPLALAPLITTILLNRKAGLLSAVLISCFVTLLIQANIYYFILAFLTASIGSLPIFQFTSRYSVFKHSIKICITNLILATILFVLIWHFTSLLTLWYIPVSVIGVFISAVFVSVLLPFYEATFDITTNLKLLELSTMNHPALNKLVLSAPGTYQHSLIVGNLAESAAAKIGANPLLARVASYFHDLGKGEHPEYFIENQYGANIHDTLSPYESAKAVIRHLQDGENIANRYRLGSAIKGILLQHHGTMATHFFYEKAKQQNKINVDIDDFRYSGPKPQTLEAALVMLADSAEASTRTLENPTYDNIYAMVEKVCNYLRDAKQLDESGLTIAQYRTVLEDYTNVLTNMYHQRIKYPEQTLPTQDTVQNNRKNMHYYYNTDTL